ncbi:hypothetical protein [Mariniblastus fucicola]|uniref:Uncharacterized protein n=1 Tax=Mariniblastus fucicola TaxID=980251 RepID=A0A5B9PCF0_9BACT|nr:hypothetical protein [Mariniblastus fucicola]QEG23924.1 hypothetical protein MFFC18_38290 [Mariniblastus fucicola]
MKAEQFTIPLALLITILAGCSRPTMAQSTFDLEPPIQASTNSSQVTLSPDPAALPVFRFATAEFDDAGNLNIVTKHATQTLVAPMPGQIDPELDPKGIPYTEKVTQTYTVAVPYTEKDDDGNVVSKIRTETRTRQVPLTRYRARNAEEQAEFEARVAEHKAELEAAGDDVINPAVPKNVTMEYTVNVPQPVTEDGKVVMKTRAETRKRTVVVYRGKSETKTELTTKTYSLDEVKCYGVDGSELDAESLKQRLVERQPVILLNSIEGITPFFETLLNPNAIFVVEPQE